MDNEKQHSQLTLKLKAGEMRYVRVQRNLSVVSIQEGQRRVAQSKPVDAANIPKGRKPAPGMTTAGFPILSFKAKITPTNGGPTLKGGDAFSIHVEVANIGNAPADDVQVLFDGDTAILSAVQTDHGQVGLVSPGWVKILDFTGTLPMNVEPHDAEVEIRLSQGQAQLPYVEVLRTTITR